MCTNEIVHDCERARRYERDRGCARSSPTRAALAEKSGIHLSFNALMKEKKKERKKKGPKERKINKTNFKVRKRKKETTNNRAKK